MPVAFPRFTTARVQPPNASTPVVTLAPKSCELTFDRTWSPYLQGTLKCRLQGSADATATDPRKALLTKFGLTQQYDSGPVQTLDVSAWLRSRVNDFGSDEATLSFASVESLMQDHVDAFGKAYVMPQTNVQVIQDALGGMNVIADGTVKLSSVAAAGSYTIPAADAGWAAGTSIWEIVNNIESPKSTWVHGDETGTALFRQAADYTPDTSTRYLYGTTTNGIPGRIIRVVDTIDRGSADWANGVFINYSGSNTAQTNAAVDYAFAGSPYLLKSYYIARKGGRTSSGEAQTRVNRMFKRGRSLVVTAIADLTCRPNQPYFVGFRDVSWFGIVRAVTFRWPEGLMDVTVDITESQS